MFTKAKNPSPVSPKGEKPNYPQPNIDLENRHNHQRRKEVKSMPSPNREGQTDMPINGHNQAPH